MTSTTAGKINNRPPTSRADQIAAVLKCTSPPTNEVYRFLWLKPTKTEELAEIVTEPHASAKGLPMRRPIPLSYKIGLQFNRLDPYAEPSPSLRHLVRC